MITILFSVPLLPSAFLAVTKLENLQRPDFNLCFVWAPWFIPSDSSQVLPFLWQSFVISPRQVLILQYCTGVLLVFYQSLDSNHLLPPIILIFWQWAMLLGKWSSLAPGAAQVSTRLFVCAILPPGPWPLDARILDKVLSLCACMQFSWFRQCISLSIWRCLPEDLEACCTNQALFLILVAKPLVPK